MQDKSALREALVGLFTIKRVVYVIVLFLLVTYIWTYQSIKQEVRDLLQEKEIEGVKVGSLVMPYSVFVDPPAQAPRPSTGRGSHDKEHP